jgi:mycothiol synthase
MRTPSMDEIAVPDRPDVPGLHFRRFRGPADYPGMAAANQAARDGAGILEVITTESMTRSYEHLVNCDRERDILVVERDGTIVGYARVEWRDQVDGTRGFTSVCLLRPEDRRLGIGGGMLGWAESRMAATAAGLPPDRPSKMRTWTWDADQGAAVLLAERGWTKAGRGYEMVRRTLEEVPEVPLPDGLEVRPVLGEAEERRVWEAAAEAFRDERDEGEWSEEDWALNLADPHRDPTLSAIAYAGDEIAAGVHGRIDPEENARHGVLQGYIAGVWTRKPYRRRGLARALLADVLVRLRERGMTSAYLGVDGLNPNQAMTLYESLGFTIGTSETDWAKPLPTRATAQEDAP